MIHQLDSRFFLSIVFFDPRKIEKKVQNVQFKMDCFTSFNDESLFVCNINSKMNGCSIAHRYIRSPMGEDVLFYWDVDDEDFIPDEDFEPF